MSDLPPPLKPDITIQDPVHGRIWLTRVERAVINTPQFQRLRGVSQLWPADFVFPGASHSRLIHSLGAAHVIGWMLRQPSLQEHFSGREEMIQILRLAALLHDLGHLPFSHIGETAYAIADGGGIDRYREDDSITAFDIAAETSSGHDLHEELTVKIISDTEVGERIDLHLGTIDGVPASELVRAIIEGTYPSDLVAVNLISSDFDCDRLDYLVRDSLSAGLTYGQVDLAYLIESLIVAEHPEYGKMVAVEEAHGAGAVEHYLIARYYHYARFVTHKTISAAEILMIVAILELIRVGKLPRDLEALRGLTGTEDFLSLTDGYGWHLLHRARVDHPGEEPLGEAAASLINRTLLKCAYQQEALEEIEPVGKHQRNDLDQLLRSPESKRRVAEEAGIDPARFCYRKSVRPLTGIPAALSPTEVIDGHSEFAARWIKAAKVATPGGRPEPLVERGEMLRHLASREWVTRRVFVREPDPAAEDKDKRPTTAALCDYLRRTIG